MVGIVDVVGAVWSRASHNNGVFCLFCGAGEGTICFAVQSHEQKGPAATDHLSDEIPIGLHILLRVLSARSNKSSSKVTHSKHTPSCVDSSDQCPRPSSTPVKKYGAAVSENKSECRIAKDALKTELQL